MVAPYRIRARRSLGYALAGLILLSGCTTAAGIGVAMAGTADVRFAWVALVCALSTSTMLLGAYAATWCSTESRS